MAVPKKRKSRSKTNIKMINKKLCNYNYSYISLIKKGVFVIDDYYGLIECFLNDTKVRIGIEPI